MERTVNPDGTRTHKLSGSEVKKLDGALAVVEEIAFFYRDTTEGTALDSLCTQLAFVAKNETLTDVAPEVGSP
ncbi:MAG: hypothetical protein WCY09_10100 [Candidatus Omnitrophota bacterium]